MGLRSELRLLRRNRDWRGRAPVPRSAQRCAPKAVSGPFPTAWARSPASRAVRSGVQRGVLRPLLWSVTRPQVHGRDLLGSVRGPAVFVANHASHLDAPLVLCSLPPDLADRMAVGAAADYFFHVRWRAVVTTLVFNAFPVERRGRAQLPSPAQELIGDGWSLLLFPEGSRSEDGWMSMFRLGPAWLCVTRQIPAVPVAIRGTYAAMPRGRTWPRPGRPGVSVRYGRPMWPREGESARDFGARVEAGIARLWVEQDTGWWRSLRGGTVEDPVSGPRLVPRGPTAAPWRRRWESSRPPARP